MSTAAPNKSYSISCTAVYTVGRHNHNPIFSTMQFFIFVHFIETDFSTCKNFFHISQISVFHASIKTLFFLFATKQIVLVSSIDRRTLSHSQSLSSPDEIWLNSAEAFSLSAMPIPKLDNDGEKLQARSRDLVIS